MNRVLGPLIVLAALASPAVAEDLRQRVGIDQKLGEPLPLDVTLRDEAGQPVRLGSLLKGKPVVLSFVYFDCPMLCNEVLNSELRMLNGMSLNIGKDFEVWTVSIDPADTPEKASLRKSKSIERYNREGAAEGWHFLTGDAESTAKLAQAAGFRYTYDAARKQYTHAAGLMIVTPEGKLARYFMGLNYPARDVRFALTEASEGRLGSLADVIMLFCYQYDPSTGRYTLAILNLVRVTGVATVLGLGILILRAERSRRLALAAIDPTSSLR